MTPSALQGAGRPHAPFIAPDQRHIAHIRCSPPSRREAACRALRSLPFTRPTTPSGRRCIRQLSPGASPRPPIFSPAALCISNVVVYHWQQPWAVARSVQPLYVVFFFFAVRAITTQSGTRSFRAPWAVSALDRRFMTALPSQSTMQPTTISSVRARSFQPHSNFYFSIVFALALTTIFARARRSLARRLRTASLSRHPRHLPGTFCCSLSLSIFPFFITEYALSERTRIRPFSSQTLRVVRS